MSIESQYMILVKVLRSTSQPEVFDVLLTERIVGNDASGQLTTKVKEALHGYRRQEKEATCPNPKP